MATLSDLRRTPRPGEPAPQCVLSLMSRVWVRTRSPEGEERRYRIVEVECFPPEDPFTQCVRLSAGQPVPSADQAICEQYGPEGFWFFRRTGPTASGDFKGGKVKGLELTCAPRGEPGGILIRSLVEVPGPDAEKPARGAPREKSFWEGPCVVVHQLLASCGSETIQDLVARDDFFPNAANPAGCLCLVRARAPDPLLCISVPRVGVFPPTEEALAAPGKEGRFARKQERYLKYPARFVVAQYAARLKKERKVVLAALGEMVGVARAIEITGLGPTRFP